MVSRMCQAQRREVKRPTEEMRNRRYLKAEQLFDSETLVASLLFIPASVFIQYYVISVRLNTLTNDIKHDGQSRFASVALLSTNAETFISVQSKYFASRLFVDQRATEANRD